MQTRDITISNQLGLHARASAKLCQLASRFSCDVYLKRDAQQVNAKSIMGVMMLAAAYGNQVTLITDGVDELEAQHSLCDLFNRKFDEEH